MKTLLLLLLICCLWACGPAPLPDHYRVQLPPSPVSRTEMLGTCRWRLEWYDSWGRLRQEDVAGSGGEIIPLIEWPSAVLAWPYWPEKGLAAGHFFPAGALIPFDVAGDTIILSWETGPEAYFYRELDKARDLNTTNRIPEYFDWKRFRTLLRENAPEELKADPWLADWKNIAERTARSGFRQSYVRAAARTGKEVTIPHTGPWLGASPFSPVEFWNEDERVLFLLSSRPGIFVCSGGMLSVSEKNYLWMPFP